MGRKWFILIDRNGRPLGPTRSALVDYELAADVKNVVATSYRHELPRVDIPLLEVYAHWDAFYTGQRPLGPGASVRALGSTEKTMLVVAAPIQLEDEEDTIPSVTASTTGPAALWFGSHGTVGTHSNHRRGVVDPRILPRQALTNLVIARLEETHIVQVDSPPMTGKTTLAALVCRELQHRRRMQQEYHQPPHDRIAIASFSMLAVYDNEPFDAAFQRDCGLPWASFLALRDDGYTLYVVFDDAQMLYARAPATPPAQDAIALWKLVHDVLTGVADRVRVLLLVGERDAEDVSPVAIPVDYVIGSAHLYFRLDEIHAYVTLWFRGLRSLKDEAAVTRLCTLLFALTGGHVGLCAMAICAMNHVVSFRVRRGCPLPTTDEWLDLIQCGSALNPIQLVERLEESNAVTVHRMLTRDSLLHLEQVLFRVDHTTINHDHDDHHDDDDAFLHRCVVLGILVRDDNGQLAFSSPVLWRYFVKNRIIRVERAKDNDAPTSLSELMRRCQHDMAVDRTIAIPTTTAEATRRRLSWSAIAIEQAWQLAFYKAVYRATPRSFRTSMDDGALFGSSVFVDLMVRHRDTVWGIERVSKDDVRRWHDRHEEVAARFAPEGEYARLKLSDFCFVRFGHSGVDVVDDTTALDGGNSDATVNGATADATATKLFVMKCYDDHERSTVPLLLNGTAKQLK